MKIFQSVNSERAVLVDSEGKQPQPDTPAHLDSSRGSGSNSATKIVLTGSLRMALANFRCREPGYHVCSLIFIILKRQATKQVTADK